MWWFARAGAQPSLMTARRWGRIVTIGSIAAKQLVPGLTVSTVMRAGRYRPHEM